MEEPPCASLEIRLYSARTSLVHACGPQSSHGVSTGPWPGLDSFGLAAIQMKPRRFTLAEVRLTAQPLLDPLDRAI